MTRGRNDTIVVISRGTRNPNRGRNIDSVGNNNCSCGLKIVALFDHWDSSSEGHKGRKECEKHHVEELVMTVIAVEQLKECVVTWLGKMIWFVILSHC